MSARQTPAATRITISQLRFGDTDARSEILNRDTEKKEFFIESFYVPAKLRVADFISGKKYFIYGQKGTGKTALLRYINEKLDPKTTSTSFVVFKEQVTEDDKQRMFSKNVALYDTPEHAEQDLLNVWRCFLHREIVRLLEEKPDFYEPDSAAHYIKLVKAVYGQADKGLFQAILKVLKGGKLAFHIAHVGGAELAAQFKNPSDEHLPTTEFIRLLDGALARIRFKPDKRLYLFIDEINLAYSNSSQHARDSILIRDLIVAVGMSNEVFAAKNLPVYILAAIRSEIVSAVDTAGSEIGKRLDDHGQKLNWYVERDLSKHPIVKLVDSKLRTNLANLAPGAKGNAWNLFFESRIYKSDSRRFVVRNTWGRPRDIVNLLSKAAEQSPNKSQFDTEAFQTSFGNFSRACWSERAQELNVFYSTVEVNSIKRALQGFRREFTIEELGAQLKARVPNDEANKRLRGSDAAATLLDTMYLVGIVGQKREPTSKKIYWMHGDDHLSFDPKYVATVHQALWAELHIA